jgi:membrane protease YdiL (CAAX protease family)/predicted RNA-binding Zn-ribbon protein involved in translation (DUF1610 family)
MNDGEKTPKKVKYCLYCGAEVKENQVYCPKCGKSVVKLKSEDLKASSQEQKPTLKKEPKQVISRKCSGCGSIITSPILEQCPICNTILEKIPKSQKAEALTTQEPTYGVIFTDKKFIPEKNLTLKKGEWNVREGLSVFGNSIILYIFISILIMMLIWFQSGGTGVVPVTIPLLLLSQIPDVIFGVYPIWYIYSKKHNFKKLGFFKESRKVFSAIVIGILGAIALILLDLFSTDILSVFYSAELNNVLNTQNQVIRNADLIWVISYATLLIIGVISTEIVFRGVLHSTLKEYFEKKWLSRVFIILLIALVYSGIYLIFSFQLILVVSNFLVFVILGILYEINGNLLNSIIANVLYTSFIIIVIYFNLAIVL